MQQHNIGEIGNQPQRSQRSQQVQQVQNSQQSRFGFQNKSPREILNELITHAEMTNTTENWHNEFQEKFTTYLQCFSSDKKEQTKQELTILQYLNGKDDNIPRKTRKEDVFMSHQALHKNCIQFQRDQLVKYLYNYASNPDRLNHIHIKCKEFLTHHKQSSLDPILVKEILDDFTTAINIINLRNNFIVSVRDCAVEQGVFNLHDDLDKVMEEIKKIHSNLQTTNLTQNQQQTQELDKYIPEKKLNLHFPENRIESIEKEMNQELESKKSTFPNILKNKIGKQAIERIKTDFLDMLNNCDSEKAIGDFIEQQYINLQFAISESNFLSSEEKKAYKKEVHECIEYKTKNPQKTNLDPSKIDPLLNHLMQEGRLKQQHDKNAQVTKLQK